MTEPVKLKYFWDENGDLHVWIPPFLSEEQQKEVCKTIDDIRKAREEEDA